MLTCATTFGTTRSNAKQLSAPAHAGDEIVDRVRAFHARARLNWISTASTPFTKSARRIPNALTEIPVAMLPTERPPRIASMNRLAVCPRRRGPAVRCNSVFAEALLMVIAPPASASSSGRIPNWSLLTDSALWAEWRKRFQGDADLAFDAVLRLAKRMAPQCGVESQRELRRIERALVGDTVSDTTYTEPVEPEEESRLPLPFTGILAILKHLAWKRAGLRPWERDV